jgi:flagellar biosynthesis protein FlhG
MTMPDQADTLRRLVRTRRGTTALVESVAPAVRARSLVFTSGKGGVGTSNLALNVAIALGNAGQRVVLVDADLGLANLDLLCGLAPLFDLGDVLGEDRPLSDTLVVGPGDIRIVPGAHGMRTLPEVLAAGPARLLADWCELETGADFLIVDAGSGLGPSIATLAAAADQVVVVTTPEPTSMADAQAALARFRRTGTAAPAFRAVVNQARSSAEARDCLARLCASSREFLGLVVTPLGAVRADPRVPAAVRGRRPFVVAAPHSPAARGVRGLARALIDERRPRARRISFFAAIADRWMLDKSPR